MNSPFKVGDTVKVLGVKGLSRASAKIIAVDYSVANGIELSESIAGSKFWSHDDLVLFPESRPTKRAPDAPKRGAKNVSSKSKIISGQARR